MNTLFDPVRYLKGVGPQREKQLSRLKIKDIFDLLWHVPRSYIDRTETVKIGNLKVGEVASIAGRIETVRTSVSSRRITVIKAVIRDDSGGIPVVWFNQAFLKNILKPGVTIFVRGKVNQGYGQVEMSAYDYEIMNKGQTAPDSGIDPVYPSTEGVSQKVWRQMVRNALIEYAPVYPEITPPGLKEELGFLPAYKAFWGIHFPAGWEQQEISRRSLALEELFLLQLAIRRELRALRDPDVKGIKNIEQDDLVTRVRRGLFFSLTRAQKRVTAEIFRDMEDDRPMNRLIQGDVGSGKTIVAALAMAKAVSSGNQAALMAPTEILAMQHFETLKKVYPPEIRLDILTGSTSPKRKEEILSGTAGGEIKILVGTHALIQESVVFNRLSLAVIDEQHRFGVSQRAVLGQKGHVPDVLVMSATPIPRTLALTIYGDLDISTIDELPPGRMPVKTLSLRDSGRSQAYQFLLKQIKQGRQGYVVCPLIEESEKQDLTDATALYQRLQAGIFRDHVVGLLHGRMRPGEKDQIVEGFRRGEIDVLVSTTVIEVGVDVPNATVMVVESAERFGLSQLHQLRGRVGRGSDQAYCILLGNPRTEVGLKRLKVMERTNDGFEIASEDLRLRGPGDIWGLKQHGLPELKLTDLWKDTDLLHITRDAASDYAVSLDEHPNILRLIAKKFPREENIAAN
ncbi:MAG: ATP-dependent DNA helicase RecG [Syntrophomonadales bacterium]